MYSNTVMFTAYQLGLIFTIVLGRPLLLSRYKQVAIAMELCQTNLNTLDAGIFKQTELVVLILIHFNRVNSRVIFLQEFVVVLHMSDY